jgi:hypothetical protein
VSGNERAERPSWTFLTNHGHVLVCIAMDPGIRGRDIAARVGITERAAQSIIADLVAGGYLTRTRVGRRNWYQIHPDLPFRHPVEREHPIGDLLKALAIPEPDSSVSRDERDGRDGEPARSRRGGDAQLPRSSRPASSPGAVSGGSWPARARRGRT